MQNFWYKENHEITFSDGCLGSRNDEERSEMRYVMRIAESVNHQIFERTLHFFFEEVLLFECLFSHLIELHCLMDFWSFQMYVNMLTINDWNEFFHVFFGQHSFFQNCVKKSVTILFTNQTSNQERRPPEFKHIIKGRKRN